MEGSRSQGGLPGEVSLSQGDSVSSGHTAVALGWGAVVDRRVPPALCAESRGGHGRVTTRHTAPAAGLSETIGPCTQFIAGVQDPVGLGPLRSDLPHGSADSKRPQLRTNFEGCCVCVCVCVCLCVCVFEFCQMDFLAPSLIC